MSKIILTVILSHLSSGSIALGSVVRQYRKVQRTHYTMTIYSTVISIFQTMLIIQKIKKSRGN